MPFLMGWAKLEQLGPWIGGAAVVWVVFQFFASNAHHRDVELLKLAADIAKHDFKGAKSPDTPMSAHIHFHFLWLRALTATPKWPNRRTRLRELLRSPTEDRRLEDLKVRYEIYQTVSFDLSKRYDTLHADYIRMKRPEATAEEPKSGIVPAPGASQ